MPKFTFECEHCDLIFDRVLKQGAYEDYPCLSCAGSAKRVWEGFGFGFAQAIKGSPGNTGVSKNDYPTADQAVGASANARWQEIHSREEVKKQVRKEGHHRALIRRQGVDQGKTYVEYEAGSDKLINGRKSLVKKINKLYGQ